MEKNKIKKMIAINIPMSQCNLKCHYCYISQLSDWEKNRYHFKLNPDLIERALSSKRLGGSCIINLTGKGETLIPVEMPEIIKKLLEQGHYLEVVTNGTLTNRFDEIKEFSPDLLKRLEFKFSFHFLELKKRGWIERFFDNVKKMRDAGCSFTVELMPNDDLLLYLDEIKELCIKELGALCHLTIGRDDTNNRKILTNMPIKEYIDTWQQFESKMFSFKYSIFNVKRQEFCYAGMWTLYVDLATGEARQCYGFRPNQNIYSNLDKPLYFRPVGRGCKQPFCFNGHAYMCLGVIPDISTPTYADIRDRVDNLGNHWLSDDLRNAFSSKLYDSNDTVEGFRRLKFYLTYPGYMFRVLNVNKNKIVPKVRRMIHPEK